MSVTITPSSEIPWDRVLGKLDSKSLEELGEAQKYLHIPWETIFDHLDHKSLGSLRATHPYFHKRVDRYAKQYSLRLASSPSSKDSTQKQMQESLANGQLPSSSSQKLDLKDDELVGVYAAGSPKLVYSGSLVARLGRRTFVSDSREISCFSSKPKEEAALDWLIKREGKVHSILGVGHRLYALCSENGQYAVHAFNARSGSQLTSAQLKVLDSATPQKLFACQGQQFLSLPKLLASFSGGSYAILDLNRLEKQEHYAPQVSAYEILDCRNEQVLARTTDGSRSIVTWPLKKPSEPKSLAEEGFKVLKAELHQAGLFILDGKAFRLVTEEGKSLILHEFGGKEPIFHADFAVTASKIRLFYKTIPEPGWNGWIFDQERDLLSRQLHEKQWSFEPTEPGKKIYYLKLAAVVGGTFALGVLSSMKKK